MAVTKMDILHWRDGVGERRREELHFPAHGLSIDEMRDFCRFHGKKLMEAAVYDSASFIPDSGDPQKKTVPRTPYHWSRSRKDSFLEDSAPLQKEDCSKAYVRECKDILPLEENIYGSPSWIGMFQVLGGFMEAFDNPFRPHRNLKISNHELSRDSPWHRIGRRGHWDGKGLALSNINFGRWKREAHLSVPLKITFRCMKYD